MAFLLTLSPLTVLTGVLQGPILGGGSVGKPNGMKATKKLSVNRVKEKNLTELIVKI